MTGQWYYHRWDFDSDVCLDCGKTREEIEEAPGPQREGSKWKLGKARCREQAEAAPTNTEENNNA